MNAQPPRRLVLTAASVIILAAACSPAALTPPVSPAASNAVAVASAAAPSASPAASASGAPSAEPTSAAASPTADASALAEPSDEPMSGTAGPGCGTGQLGFFTHRDEIPPTIHFGGATIEFATAFVGLRNGTYNADDVIPAGLGLTPGEIAVKVAPGTHILLRGEGLTLTKVSVSGVPWSTVDFSGGLGWSDATQSPLATRVRSDGSISVSAPDQQGDYMVFFGPRWRSACLQGDGAAYSRIKVVGS